MMTNKNSFHPTGRPLFIDFSAYTDGDSDFKKEFIDLIIDNLLELKQAVHLAFQEKDVHLFHRICHKVKVTLHILDDRELLDTVNQLKIIFTDPLRIYFLDKMCTDIIESLRKA